MKKTRIKFTATFKAQVDAPSRLRYNLNLEGASTWFSVNLDTAGEFKNSSIG
jgi:hypothetical protein